MKDNTLMQIANVLSANVQKLPSPSLLEGKMGVAIFLYHYARYSGRTAYAKLADNLMSEIIESMSGHQISFASGLSGIGWGIKHLLKENFIEGDDNILEDLDDCIVRYIKAHTDEDMLDGCVYLALCNTQLLKELLDPKKILAKSVLHERCTSILAENDFQDEGMETVWKQLVYFGEIRKGKCDIGKISKMTRNILKDFSEHDMYLASGLPAMGMYILLTNLSQFKENFIKRYEEREMPLPFVLDNELGIGYNGNTSGDISPLVDDLAVPRTNSPSNDSHSPIQPILLQKYQQSLQRVIELTDEDVKGVEAVWDDLPPTISVMCQVLQDDEKGSSVYIQSAGGHSAANLLGRFCHLDEQILNHTLNIAEKETQMKPDVIFAEIVHLPESRIGNILLRPVLRPHEIPYLAKPSVSREYEIRPDDLFVSVKNKRIVLRSKRLNKEIIPRMSTAHNYSGQNPMPVYHFLCDLQHQNGRTVLGFFLNDAAQQLDYLPRVVYKNCILSQARWTVRGKETKTFVEIKDDSELLQKIKEWQKMRNIPDKVLLADGDNELYVDLNNPLSIRVWLSIVKKRPSFRMEEFLFDPATAVVHGPEGVFTNEFIFAFYRESK